MTSDTAFLEATDMNPLLSHQSPLQSYLLKLQCAPVVISKPCEAIHYRRSMIRSNKRRIVPSFTVNLHLKPGLTRIWQSCRTYTLPWAK